MKLETLDSKIGLHENIDIYYCVDGYGARFYTGDGSHDVADGRGETIMGALLDLESKVKDFNRKEFFNKLNINTKGAETGRFQSQEVVSVAELAKRLGWDEDRLRRNLGLRTI